MVDVHFQFLSVEPGALSSRLIFPFSCVGSSRIFMIISQSELPYVAFCVCDPADRYLLQLID